MYRVGLAGLAVLMSVVLLSGAAYTASFLALLFMRAIVHDGPATAISISIATSLFCCFLAIWADRRSRDQ